MRTVKIGINQRRGCVFYSSCFAFICEPLPFLSRISEHNVALIVYSLMPGTSAKQVTSCYLLRYSGYKQSFPHQPLVSLSLSLEDKNLQLFLVTELDCRTRVHPRDVFCIPLDLSRIYCNWYMDLSEFFPPPLFLLKIVLRVKMM